MTGSWGRLVTGNKNLGRGRANKINGNNTFIRQHQYNPGETHRLTIPLVNTEKGMRPLIVEVPTHRVKKVGQLLGTSKRDGNRYRLYQVRSNQILSNAYTDTQSGDVEWIVEQGEPCLFANLVRLQEHDLWAQVKDKFGDNKERTQAEKDEMRQFIKAIQDNFILEPVYTPASQGYDARTHTEQNILMLQFETETRTEKNARGIEKDVEVVLTDENGQPKWKPVIMRLGKQRAEMISNEIDKMVETGVLKDEHLHPFVEFEGTEDAIEVFTGWVDLTFSYPTGDKQLSGRNLSVTVTNPVNTAVTPELIESFKGEVGDDVKQRTLTALSVRPDLRLNTFAEQYELLSSEAKEIYETLAEKYADDLEEWNKKYLETLSKFSSGSSSSTTTQKPEEESDEETVEETVDETPEETPETANKTQNIEDLLNSL